MRASFIQPSAGALYTNHIFAHAHTFAFALRVLLGKLLRFCLQAFTKREYIAAGETSLAAAATKNTQNEFEMRAIDELMAHNNFLMSSFHSGATPTQTISLTINIDICMYIGAAVNARAADTKNFAYP